MDNAQVITPQTTMAQWLAEVFRSIATRLDGPIIEPPTIAQIKREQMLEAQVALLDAEAQAERYTHTAQMLRKRLARLSSGETT